MKKKDKATFIQKILDELFPNPEIPLRHKNPYTLLIAVLLSAQCTDQRVNEVSFKLFLKASSPEEMIKLDIHEIENIIKPCGLWKTKAKAIFYLSDILINKYKGKVPQTLSALESLPGVGHKTASVVMAQAFNKDTFPVDTHIHRLAKRWGLSSGKSVEETEKDLKKIFPKKSWKRLHLQIIYFARKYCPARGHKEALCPICKKILNENGP